MFHIFIPELPPPPPHPSPPPKKKKEKKKKSKRKEVKPSFLEIFHKFSFQDYRISLVD